ncbi:hypothetical protein [Nocardioides sp.]|uniref:hypothetical protein n=1 Tax=Nocardioides sp. TaxID=35761 RepID=UPI002ED9E826
MATDETVLSPTTRQLLVLSPQAGSGPAHVAAATVAAVRPELSVRVVAVPFSTTAMMRAVEMVPDRVHGANAVFADVRARLDALTWGAWLPSVAKLTTPAPTLRQHVHSWLRDRSGYLAVHGDPGWVAKLPIGQLAPDRQLPRVPPRGVVATAYDCHAFGELPEVAVATLFSMGLTSRPVRREATSDPTPVWGTAKAVEFVVAWPGVAELSPATGRCPICDEAVWGHDCAFCRVRAIPGPAVPVTAQPAGTPPPATAPHLASLSTAGGATQ